MVDNLVPVPVNYPLPQTDGKINIYVAKASLTNYGTVKLSDDFEINPTTGQLEIVEDFESLKDDVAELQSDVSTLQSDMSTAQSDINTLQSDVGTLQGDVSTLKEEMDTAQEDIIDLENTVLYKKDLDVDDNEEKLNGVEYKSNISDGFVNILSFKSEPEALIKEQLEIKNGLTPQARSLTFSTYLITASNYIRIATPTAPENISTIVVNRGADNLARKVKFLVYVSGATTQDLSRFENYNYYVNVAVLKLYIGANSESNLADRPLATFSKVNVDHINKTADIVCSYTVLESDYTGYALPATLYASVRVATGTPASQTGLVTIKVYTNEVDCPVLNPVDEIVLVETIDTGNNFVNLLHGKVTQTRDGLMSKEDKIILDNLPNDADVSTAISNHNISETAHADIRAMINGINTAIAFDSNAQISSWIAGTYTRPDNIVVGDLTIGQVIYNRTQTEDNYRVITLPVEAIGDLQVRPEDEVDLTDYFNKNSDTLADVESGYTATNYAPTSTDGDGHLAGIDTALGTKEIIIPVTKDLYVDVNRTDIYTQDGSEARKFKTLAQAAAIATNGMNIHLTSGTYAEDVTFTGGVSLINDSNVSATISGDVTFSAGGVPISIKGCVFTGTSKTLTINGTTHIFESYSYNKVVCGAGANVESHIFNVNCQESGTDAITFNGTGYLNMHGGDVTALGSASAINQTDGLVVLDGCKLYNSEATKATLLSVGGTVNANFTSAVNATGGNAINLSANSATSTNPNALLNIIAVGDVVGKDTNTTIVSNIKFITTGTLVGAGLIFQPASQLAYDSSTTVKDRIDSKQATLVTATVEIAVGDWTANVATKTVSGVTATNIITVSPAPASYLDYANAQIRATAQATDSLEFTCTTTPTTTITVNVVIG